MKILGYSHLASCKASNKILSVQLVVHTLKRVVMHTMSLGLLMHISLHIADSVQEPQKCTTCSLFTMLCFETCEVGKKTRKHLDEHSNNAIIF